MSLDVDQDPFHKVHDLLSNSDLLFGNLETSINSNEETNKAVPLSTSLSHLDYITKGGFDLVNLANNHTLDSGSEGLAQAAGKLRKDGIKCVGLEKQYPDSGLQIIERKGIRVGVLGYTESIGQFSINHIMSGDIVNNKDFFMGRRNTFYTQKEASEGGLSQYILNKVRSDIQLAKRFCDFLIVSIHWGTENVYYPSPRQVNDARTIIDAGADIILGHHPHVPQGIEQYDGGVIVYSLGNFQFDVEKSQSPTPYSYYIEFELYTSGRLGYDIYPIIIDADSIPTPLKQQMITIVRKEIRQLSEMIEYNQITWDKWFASVAPTYLTGNLRSYIHRTREQGFNPMIESILWLFSPFTVRSIVSRVKTAPDDRLREPKYLDYRPSS